MLGQLERTHRESPGRLRNEVGEHIAAVVDRHARLGLRHKLTIDVSKKFTHSFGRLAYLAVINVTSNPDPQWPNW